MKNKSTILAIAILVLLSAGATLFFTSRDMSGKRMGGVMPMGVSEPAMQAGRASGELSLTMDSVAPTVGGGATSKMIAPDYYPMPPYYGNDALSVEDRSIVKSSNHQVVVDDVSTYIRQMKEYIASVDGKVLNTSIDSQEKYQFGAIYAKVPVTKFEEAANRATEGVKKVTSENINASDVTGQVVGTNESLQKLEESKKLREAELADLKTKNSAATTIALKQQEIDRIQRQIEQLQQQAESVQAQVEYATVNISAANSERYFLGAMYEPTMREEFERALESLGGSGRALRSLFIWVVVYSVIWAPVVLIFKWVKNKAARKQQTV